MKEPRVCEWQVIRARLGHAIKGRIDDIDRNVVYTEQFVARHRAKIRGMFSAATKYVAVFLRKNIN